MSLTCITCTADRPWAIARAEFLMARQTRPPDEWVVADDGVVPAQLTQGQTHLRRAPSRSGPESLTGNLIAALAVATGDRLVIIEDDDWYAPEYLAVCEARLRQAEVIGCPTLRYYHVASRQHVTMPNIGSALFQTALRRRYRSWLVSAAEQAALAQTYNVDGRFWQALPTGVGKLYDTPLTVGIKGMPGRPGLGIGHRPARDKPWHHDPNGQQLYRWIGDDAPYYLDTPR